jgi:HEAT repeat protein
MRELEGFGAGVLSELIAALDHEDETVRWRSATLLDKIGRGAEAAVPKLISLARDAMQRPMYYHVFIWQYSVKALARISDPRAIPFFLEIVNDANLPLFDFDYDLLRVIEGGFASHFIHALKDALPQMDDEIRIRASMALAKLDSANALRYIPGITVGLQNQDAGRRQTALEVLGRLELMAQSAVPDVCRALADSDPNLRAAAAGVLRQIGLATDDVLHSLQHRLEIDDNAKVNRECKISLSQLMNARGRDNE